MNKAESFEFLVSIYSNIAGYGPRSMQLNVDEFSERFHRNFLLFSPFHRSNNRQRQLAVQHSRLTRYLICQLKLGSCMVILSYTIGIANKSSSFFANKGQGSWIAALQSADQSTESSNFRCVCVAPGVLVQVFYLGGCGSTVPVFLQCSRFIFVQYKAL